MNALRCLIMPSIAGSMWIALAGGAGGCAARGGLAIPATATVLASGNGKLSATAPSGGNIYVYDATANRVVYSGIVRGGEQVVVDPDANLVTINGNTVAEPHLRNGHEYKVEFDHP